MRAIPAFSFAAVLVALMGGAAFRAAPARAPQEPTTHGEWVLIRRGTDSLRAYVAYPERKDRAPAVLVIHEIFGLTGWEPSVADRLAAEGFVAIVPDLLSSRFGITPASADSGRKLIALLKPDDVTRDLDLAAEYINAQPGVAKGKLGVMGFCWGGAQTFRYATTNPKLRAAVVFYGAAPDSAAIRRIRAPVLGVYGENDARINDALPEVERQMKAAGKRFTYDIYPGTGHGFMKPGRKGNDGPQVERAWTRVLQFLRLRME